MSATLLVIGYVWPEPDSSAAGYRMLSLLRLFKQQDWRVIFATPAQKTQYMIDLNAESIESRSIKLNDSSFDQQLKEISPDYVLFDRFMMEEQFGWRVSKHCPDAVRILDTEDLQFLRHARHTAIKANRQLHDNDFNSDLAKREIASIVRSDLSLIISDYECQLLTETFKLDSHILYQLPFMIDLNQSFAPVKLFNARKHFVTIGNFRHAPNWDSVLFLHKIWPSIKLALPQAELHIYGAYADKKTTQLHHAAKGFIIKGRAANAYDVLADARVCLAPLRFGAGIKGKLIDAMQVKTPCITTDIGAEGMLGKHQWPGIIANSQQEIIAAAIELYQNENLWQQKQQLIPALLKDRYDKIPLGKKLIDKILQLKKNLQQVRQRNFYGAMLNYHSMRSTEYMSRWIEAKNINANNQA